MDCTWMFERHAAPVSFTVSKVITWPCLPRLPHLSYARSEVCCCARPPRPNVSLWEHACVHSCLLVWRRRSVNLLAAANPKGGHLPLITTKLSLMGPSCCSYLLKGRWWNRWPLGDFLPRWGGGVLQRFISSPFFLAWKDSVCTVTARLLYVPLLTRQMAFYTFHNAVWKRAHRKHEDWLLAFITVKVDLFTGRRWICDSTRASDRCAWK